MDAAAGADRVVRVLVAPDSFKGTHGADVVAASVASGLRSVGAEPVRLPLADGGEGTLDVLRRAFRGAVHHVPVTGPLGTPVVGRFLVSEDRRTAVVETASASGLSLVVPDPRSAWDASTRGTGELVAAAVASGAERILLGVGGSATTDGGAGAIESILEHGGLGGCRLEVLCDVTTPFEQAAAVYAPQKGADTVTVARLEERLASLAGRLPRDPRGVPRTGCAGGLSGGLWARFGAELRSGIEVVLDALGFAAAARPCAAVITGEGRLDGQTREGKVIAGVLEACRRAEGPLPVHAVVGQTRLSAAEAGALGLSSVTVASTVDELVEAGRRLGRRLLGEQDLAAWATSTRP
ncbi:glycerate kinase [Nocardioides plantarum]|uniref:Glycerate kinase n=2 Tax=Nocardioides plantarum TaxID=29299 RepID=A0ABV5K776_9ACTN|nr:glycerate kinase [Nocardioides plantarum]